MTNSYSFNLIKDYYGDRVAARSQVPLINHIIEGMEILTMIGANDLAKDAFCIHPMIQNDDDMVKTYERLFTTDPSILDPRVVYYALEYRNIANQYLSFREIDSLDDITLSPIPEVNQMLVADKVQNYKDFLIYHQATHKRSRELTHYFCNWLKKLNAVHIFDTYFELKR
ncbi:hypothetical protein [Stenotrophomonas phage RAS14]